MTRLPLTPEYLSELQSQAVNAGRQCLVTALVIDAYQRLFVMRRSPIRKTYPNCWEMPGGHVEVGETLAQALARECWEETGWQLVYLLDLIEIEDYDAGVNDEVADKRNFLFTVEVTGDLQCPHVETDKVSEFRWLGLADLAAFANELSIADAGLLERVQKTLGRYG